MPENLAYTKEKIWDFLSKIPDPEIPVISIAELGVLRKVEVNKSKVIVTITPTYSGCPAMKTFEDDIASTLKRIGIPNYEILTVHSPPWTTDWLTKEAREKLKAFGIAPPVIGSADKGILFSSGSTPVKCIQCDSTNTKLISQFGSTACKALYKCDDCLEPFDYFKCI